MKWKLPKEGTVDFKRKFAFFPVHTIDEQIVWLEFIYRKRTFQFGVWHTHRGAYLPEHKDVQQWLLSQSPLSKAMKE